MIQVRYLKRIPNTEDNDVLEKITENTSVLFWTTKNDNI